MGSLFRSEKNLKSLVQYFPTIASGAARIIDRLFAKKALVKYTRSQNSIQFAASTQLQAQLASSKSSSTSSGALVNVGYVSSLNQFTGYQMIGGGGAGGLNNPNQSTVYGMGGAGWNGNGTISSITITNAGSGYTSAPLVTFSGGNSINRPIEPEIYSEDY